MANKTDATRKASGKKRTGKRKGVKRSNGAPASEQDPKRRLGNYGTAGEHPRQGSRTAGIVGQTKQQSRTDKRGKKSK